MLGVCGWGEWGGAEGEEVPPEKRTSLPGTWPELGVEGNFPKTLFCLLDFSSMVVHVFVYGTLIYSREMGNVIPCWRSRWNGKRKQEDAQELSSHMGDNDIDLDLSTG